MKNFFTTKRLCRAGIIAALYMALTYAFAPFAFGPFQIRPAEALCILPLLFPEAVPALAIGCALSNLTSPFALYDVPIGALTTLVAALITYMVGRFIKKEPISFLVAGVAPVLLNAIVIPLLLVFLYKDVGSFESLTAAYFAYAGSIFLTQTVWVYGLGAPVYFTLARLRKKSSISFLS